MRVDVSVSVVCKLGVRARRDVKGKKELEWWRVGWDLTPKAVVISDIGFELVCDSEGKSELILRS